MLAKPPGVYFWPRRCGLSNADGTLVEGDSGAFGRIKEGFTELGAGEECVGREIRNRGWVEELVR